MDNNFLEIEKKVLKERAKILALPVIKENSKSEERNILLFSALNQNMAIYLSSIEAVTQITDIVSIPHTPKHIPGVIRRKGSTIALVNLRFFFYPDTENLIDEDYAIIVKAKNKIFALQVNDIKGVIPLLTSQIKKIPDNFDSAIAPYVSGITSDDTVILNIDKMVTSEGFGTTGIEN
ncbi:MAG: chemotaxis protein CheW [Deltaproteobacteria bacterium]|nr:chemotaxis protein CheW [Deltaproteobacteria bacterium]